MRFTWTDHYSTQILNFQTTNQVKAGKEKIIFYLWIHNHMKLQSFGPDVICSTDSRDEEGAFTSMKNEVFVG